MKKNEKIEKSNEGIKNEKTKNKNVFDAIEDSFRDSAWRSWKSGEFKW